MSKTRWDTQYTAPDIQTPRPALNIQRNAQVILEHLPIAKDVLIRQRFVLHLRNIQLQLSGRRCRTGWISGRAQTGPRGTVDGSSANWGTTTGIVSSHHGRVFACI